MEKNQIKKEIRNEIRDKLSHLTSKEVKEKSQHIMEKLCSLEDFCSAGKVFIYVSVGREPDTRFLIQDYLDKKEIYVPRCKDDDTLEAVRLEGLEYLQKGRYGIPEPVESLREFFHPEGPSIIIVPGTAFDARGFRLGRGKGCYDRCLNHYLKKSPVWGLCYDFQILSHIPDESWDIKVDGIITEKRILRTA